MSRKELPASTSGTSNGNGNGNGNSKSRAKMRMVGDWQLGKTLGAGSMGKVKLATNAHTRERVS